jgi:DNA polymerase III delta prime subunit
MQHNSNGHQVWKDLTLHIKLKDKYKILFFSLIYNHFMHAFLVIGNNKSLIDDAFEKIASKENVLRILSCSVQKIEDIRSLAESLRYSYSQKTAFLLQDIGSATAEAMNAFLKNLEEPHDNIVFFLTAKKVDEVLPTILSRCQIIRTNSILQISLNPNLENFVGKSIGEKLLYLDSLKKREEAILFLQNFIYLLHENLTKEDSGYGKTASYLEKTQKTLDSLNANGNVTIQLTDLAIQLTSLKS